MRKILVILNPAARSTRAAGQRERIAALPGEPDVVLTSEAGEARMLASGAAALGYDTGVAAGGGGTSNENVNRVVGTDVMLGVLPVGTMNVFALELGVPSKVREAWAIIQRGEAREIDLACANQHYFVQLAGVGLDAQVVKETSLAMKRNLGPLSYVV